MNKKTNEFKSALKNEFTYDKATSENLLHESDILKKLGLTSLPDNLLVSLSENQKFLNIQLKKERIQNTKPLLFQIPIIEDDLNEYYKNNEDLEDLSDRYEKYSIDYKEKIKEYSLKERKYLQGLYPGLVFNLKIRMKSKASYEKKLNDNIKKGKNLYLHDIIAERIIISEYNGSRDPEVLQEACYIVAQALYEFRINTDFRMKSVDSKEEVIAQNSKPYITKDYIKNPKENGYQSLHILVEDSTNTDCSYETQIRTFDMEEYSKKDEAAHRAYKPRLFNDKSTLRVPKYSTISPFVDSNGDPIMVDLTLKEAFYHFYNVSFDQYKSELTEIQKVINFQNIRKKLKPLTQEKTI